MPLYQEVERVQWDKWVTHGSVKIHSPEAARIRQQVPQGKTFALGSGRESVAREGKSTIGHSGSALSGTMLKDW